MFLPTGLKAGVWLFKQKSKRIPEYLKSQTAFFMCLNQPAPASSDKEQDEVHLTLSVSIFVTSVVLLPPKSV